MREKIQKIVKSEITWEVLFLGFLFCFFMGWAIFMPYNSCPDEDQRNRVALFIYDNWRLPHGGDPAIRNEIWGFSYAFNPILSYMIGGVFMKITSVFTTDTAWLVLASRMVSVLSGMGTAWFAIRIGKKLFSGTKRVLFVAIVTLLPGAVFVNSYINCDALALFSIAIMVYMWIRGMETQWDLRYCVGLGVGVSVCALSYYNAYGVILSSILFFAFSVLFCFRKQWDFKTMFKKGLLISAVVLALAGWWFIRNAVLYDGDILGMRTTSYYGELYAQDGMKPSQRISAANAGLSLWEMLIHGYNSTGVGWLQQSLTSFIGCFGQLDMPLPLWITQPYLCFLGIGFVGSMIHFPTDFALKKDGRWKIMGMFRWCMMIAVIIPFVLNMVYSYTSDYQPQGRYSLPMLLPLAYFVTSGTGNLLEVWVKNKKLREVVYAGLSAVLLLIALYAYFKVIRGSVAYLTNALIQF